MMHRNMAVTSNTTNAKMCVTTMDGVTGAAASTTHDVILTGHMPALWQPEKCQMRTCIHGEPNTFQQHGGMAQNLCWNHQMMK